MTRIRKRSSRVDSPGWKPVLLGAGLFAWLAGDVIPSTITLTTTYPSPSGVYGSIITTGRSSGATVNTVLVRDAGSVAIGKPAPGYLLDVNGDIAGTNLILSSDARLKREIAPLQGSLDRLAQLHGVSFKWRKSGASDIGLLAQDVRPVFPELVSADPKSGLLGLKYTGMIAPLVSAVQELRDRWRAHDARLERLETENLALKEELAALRKRIEPPAGAHR